MFKKIFKNKDAERHDEQPKNMPYLVKTEDLEKKPFTLDVNNVWDYDREQLCDFILRYESYTNSILKKYHELQNDNAFIKGRIEVIEQERKRLVQESEQYKIYIENLKQSLNERSLSEPSSSPLKFSTTTPVDKNKIEEIIKEKIKIRGIDTGLIDELRKSGNKIINQLSEFRNVMLTSKSTNEKSLNGNGHYNEGIEGEEGVIISLGTVDQREEMITLNLSKSFKDGFLQIVDDMEMTFQLILPKFLTVNDKLKQREKEIGDLLKGDFLHTLRLLDDAQKEIFSSDQVVEIENKANDLRNKLIKTESTLSDLSTEVSAKNEQIEKTQKVIEKLEKDLKFARQISSDQAREHKTEVTQLNYKIQDLQEKLRSAENHVESLQNEKTNSDTQAEMVTKEYQVLQSGKMRTEEEKASVVGSLQNIIETLENENKRYKDNVDKIEQDKNDLENKLIQEKLKHHHTVTDLQKLKVSLFKAEQDLNEEVKNRQTDLKKNEDLKKQIMELDKKRTEYKKTIKKLSEQVLELQNSVESEKANKEKQINSSHEMVILETDVDSQVTNEQNEKMRELNENLEKALEQVSSLALENRAIKEKNNDLDSQVRALQKKREKGLEEISKLSNIIEEIKTHSPGLKISRGASAVSSNYLPSMTTLNDSGRSIKKSEYSIPNSASLATPTKRVTPNKQSSKYLQGIKTNLKQLYNEVITAIANYSTTKHFDSSPRLNSSTNDPSNVSESLVKIEKKVNDVMFMMHEYLESLEQ